LKPWIRIRIRDADSGSGSRSFKITDKFKNIEFQMERIEYSFQDFFNLFGRTLASLNFVSVL